MRGFWASADDAVLDDDLDGQILTLVTKTPAVGVRCKSFCQQITTVRQEGRIGAQLSVSIISMAEGQNVQIVNGIMMAHVSGLVGNVNRRAYAARDFGHQADQKLYAIFHVFTKPDITEDLVLRVQGDDGSPFANTSSNTRLSETFTVQGSSFKSGRP